MPLSFTIHQDALFVIYDVDENRPLATGFCFIKPEWVVTAKHVVQDMGLSRSNLSLLSFSSTPVSASTIFVHEHYDLAVLRINGRSPCDVPLFPGYEEYTGGKGLVCCGYAPSRRRSDERPYPLLTSDVLTYDREERIRDHGDESLIVFDHPDMELGHSGGPVFGEGGGVVAVLIDRMRPSDGVVRARATSIISLLEFLTFEAS
jgi:Trypsin-like peptidase domain